MNVAVSCAGRFHAFHLVEQLHKRGMLSRFTTTTLNSTLIPNRELPESLKHDVEFHKLVRQVPFPEYLCYAWRKLPIQDAQSMAYFLKDNLYDQKATRYVGKSDIFTGWANQSLFQLREAKSRGAIGIIERGSTHIQKQHALLQEERKRYGLGELQLGKYDKLLEEKQLKEYHETDYIMVPSEFARKSFLEYGFKSSQILKVPYGVDLDRFSVGNQLREIGGPLKILFIGPIGVQKGIAYLLEAVAKLEQQGVRTELTVIGQIESEFASWFKSSPLRSQIKRHVPYVPNNQIAEYFKAADLFCLPSIQEGLALVIAEAMACGLPIVATENTGAEEFIRNGVEGTILKAGDADALFTALHEMQSDRGRMRTMGEAAAVRSKAFSWDTYGERIAKIYNALVHPAPNDAEHDRDEIANYYDDYWDREKGWTPVHSFTDEQLHVHFDNAFKPTDSVLDVGCGDASNYQAWLVKKVAKLSAVDISKTGVAEARKIGLDAIVHDFSEPFPYADETFDGAVCIEVLEHLYDPKFCVQEVGRILKKDGLFVTSVPNNGYFRERLKALTRAEMSTSITDFTNEWKGAHIRFYSMDSFTRMLEVSGFRIESVRSNGDASILDGLDAFGGYMTQHATSLFRKKAPAALKLSFLQDVWPSLFAPHIIVRARKE
jgi:starch synthase